MKIKRTSISLPEKLWKAIRTRAIGEGRNAQEIVAEALEEWLRKPKKGARSHEG
jgi:metal-responsive CopG/Arc/MetJ family transcriptional regulator